MTLEPFDNTLTCVRTNDSGALVEHLTVATGPVVCDPRPLPGPPSGRAVTVVTTAYLAVTHLDDRHPVTPYPALGDWPVPVREMLRGVLLAEVAGRR